MTKIIIVLSPHDIAIMSPKPVESCFFTALARIEKYVLCWYEKKKKDLEDIYIYDIRNFKTLFVNYHFH